MLGQALITQFGGVVFNIDPAGLQGINWLISILIGLGSIVVGFLVRLLPEIELPVWLLGGRSEPVKPAESVESLPAAGSQAVLTAVAPFGSESRPNLARQRWKLAITAARNQIKPVNIYAPPPGETSLLPENRRRSSSVVASPATEPPMSPWERLSAYLATSSAFRRRMQTSTRMVDPRRIRNAQLARVSRSTVP